MDSNHSEKQQNGAQDVVLGTGTAVTGVGTSLDPRMAAVRLGGTSFSHT